MVKSGATSILTRSRVSPEHRHQLQDFRRHGNVLPGGLAQVDERPRRVVVDFRALELMSSSCFESFVTWIGQVQEALPGERYPIEFRSNAQMHWQRRSLNALRCFALDLVTIA